MSFLNFLRDHTGQLSSTRLFMLLVCLATIFDWIYSVIKVGVWNPNPEVLLFVTGILGLKVMQKKDELNADKS